MPIILFIIAALYAAVGHGGASGYLAAMAIMGAAPASMKPTALLLNLFVSAVAFIQFYRGGHFRWGLFWPFAVLSVAMAWLGGRTSLDVQVYKYMLGVLLLFPVLRILVRRELEVSELRPASMPVSVAMGGVIGYISGLIGIGGGVLLSPLLLLLRWATQQQAAAVSALFIFVNSAAGLLGQWSKGLTYEPHIVQWALAAFAGGLVGAYSGALKMHQRQLKYALVVVLLIAVFKLFQ
jgi:uncharacterized protein